VTTGSGEVVLASNTAPADGRAFSRATASVRYQRNRWAAEPEGRMAAASRSPTSPRERSFHEILDLRGQATQPVDARERAQHVGGDGVGHGAVVLPEAYPPQESAVRHPEEPGARAVWSSQRETYFPHELGPSGRSASNGLGQKRFRARTRSVQDSTIPPSTRRAVGRKVRVGDRGTWGPVTAPREPATAAGPPRGSRRRRSGATPGKRPSGRVPPTRAERPVGPTGRSLAGRRRGALTRSGRRSRSDGRVRPSVRDRRSEALSEECRGGPHPGFGAERVVQRRDSRSNRGTRGERGRRGRRGTHGGSTPGGARAYGRDRSR